MYDQFADRWILSEFNEGASSASSFYIVFSVSSGGDPISSSWTSYQLDTSPFPDYPKWGIWDDSYIISSNEGINIGNYVVNRSEVLAGAGVSYIKTSFSNTNASFQAGAPVSVFGSLNPPVSEPAIILNLEDDEWAGPTSCLLYTSPSPRDQRGSRMPSSA